MRIALVEDEAGLRDHLAGRLRHEGYVVDVAADGDEGLYTVLECPVDLAIIDLGLPGRSGLSLIRELRAAGRTYPVIILTARSRWQEKVEGLEAGADDYLTKPFHDEELMARLQALLRRSGGWAAPVVDWGPIRVDTARERVTVDGGEVSLTGFEYRVLAYLLHRPGAVVSKQALVEHLYDDADQRDSNVIEVIVGRLRRKLDPDGTRQPLETLRGRGYRLTPPTDGGT